MVRDVLSNDSIRDQLALSTVLLVDVLVEFGESPFAGSVDLKQLVQFYY